ncbi:hypothetical protein B0O80DRAFT_66993 [Mortierella sp. GBAus27b]|nr:hypothetical protein B0O80DRAFT_66993 [Mortierella sp. GBAus27b]
MAGMERAHSPIAICGCLFFLSVLVVVHAMKPHGACHLKRSRNSFNTVLYGYSLFVAIVGGSTTDGNIGVVPANLDVHKFFKTVDARNWDRAASFCKFRDNRSAQEHTTIFENSLTVISTHASVSPKLRQRAAQILATFAPDSFTQDFAEAVLESSRKLAQTTGQTFHLNLVEGAMGHGANQATTPPAKKRTTASDSSTRKRKAQDSEHDDEVLSGAEIEELISSVSAVKHDLCDEVHSHPLCSIILVSICAA